MNSSENSLQTDETSEEMNSENSRDDVEFEDNLSGSDDNDNAQQQFLKLCDYQVLGMVSRNKELFLFDRQI